MKCFAVGLFSGLFGSWWERMARTRHFDLDESLSVALSCGIWYSDVAT